MHRLFLAGVTGLLAAQGLASVEWQNTFSHSVPEPASMEFAARDGQNNTYFFGETGNGDSTLWKFTPAATLVYRQPLPSVGLPGSAMFVGTHGDLFYGENAVSRIDRATGATLWSVSTPNLMVTYVDESGDVYLTGRFDNRTEKRSHENGALLWSADVKMVPSHGANFLGTSGSVVSVLAKSNGQVLGSVALSPTPVGALRGVPMADGKVFLMDAQNRGYAYRPGQATLNLGLIAPYQTVSDFRSTPNGFAFVKSGLELACFNSSFQKVWTTFNFKSVSDIDGDFALINAEVFRVSTGEDVAGQDGLGTYFAGDSLLTPSFTTAGQPKLLRRDRATNATLSTWEPTTKVQGAGRFVTGIAGPGADLLAVTEVAGSFYLTRIAAAGQQRWSLRLGPESNDETAGISLSKDKRTAYIWFAGGSMMTYEVDVTKASLSKSYLGQTIAKGDFIYRTNTNNSAPLRTSKFDATGKELWRIARIGFMSIGDDGSVYVGGTKNRAQDGQRVWVAPGTPKHLVPLGDRVAALDGRNLTLLNAANGQALWTKTLGADTDPDQRSDFELRRKNGRIAIRWNHTFGPAYELNELTGGTIKSGNWGFWDAADNFYRVGAGLGVVRCNGFDDGTGTLVDPLSANAQGYVADGTGGFYLVGIDMIGTPGSLYVAKWRP